MKAMGLKTGLTPDMENELQAARMTATEPVMRENTPGGKTGW